LVQAERSYDEPGLLDIHSAAEKAVALRGLGKGRTALVAGTPTPLRRVLASESDVIHIVLHLILNARQMGGEDVLIEIVLPSEEASQCTLRTKARASPNATFRTCSSRSLQRGDRVPISVSG
jgi:hypothetical protein